MIINNTFTLSFHFQNIRKFNGNFVYVLFLLNILLFATFL